MNTFFSKKFIYCALIFLCLLVYANSLDNQLVSDDIETIVKSNALSDPLQHWRSLISFTQSLIYQFAKTNPVPYHIFNIFLHIVDTILVFLFLKLFFSRDASFFGACVFAVHPLHTEAVTWISGGAYLYITFFILTCYLLYYRATHDTTTALRKRRVFYLISLVLFSYFILGQYSFFAIFPFMLIASDIIFGTWRRNWKFWLPFLIIVFLRIFLLKGVLAERVATVAEDIGPEKSNLIFNMAYSLYSHLGLLLWPQNLTLYHEPSVITKFALNLELIGLCIFVVFLPLLYKKAKPVLFGLVIFWLFLGPTYSPVTISWLLAERYVYFPSIMLSMVLCFIYDRSGTKEVYIGKGKGERVRVAKTGFIVFFAILISIYAVRTVIRNEDWNTPERFWRETVKVSSLSHRAWNNLADIYASEGNLQGALQGFAKAIELRPTYADAYHNLANTYQRLGNIDKAFELYKKAVELKPALLESQYNLGVIYLNAGEVDLAIEKFKIALQLKPNDAEIAAALDIAMKAKEGQ